VILVALAFITSTSIPAQNATWPASQTVKFVVPTSAGGGTDTLARLLAQRLQEKLRATFVVDNRPGASGNIGTTLVKAETPNGNALLFTQAAHSANIGFFKSRYHPVNDFDPVAFIGITTFMVCVNVSSPITAFRDFMDTVRSKGDRFTYGSGGYATSSHLAIELLQSVAGVKMTHVPFKGTTPAVTALLASQVDSAVGTDSSMLEHHRSGKVRCLASTAGVRSPLFPELPTIAEAASLPNYELDTWYGILGPVGLPRHVIDVMNREVNLLLRDQEFVAKHIAPMGVIAQPTTPEAFRQRLEAEVPKYQKIARDANVTPIE
jgi:tripartite-type tricarboxylate transporter receptor subunit TctC